MKKSILITGVSGAGKSALSEKLRELGYTAYDMDDHPGLCAMINKTTGQPVEDHDSADLQKVKAMDWICSKGKLTSIIAHETAEIAFYCGSASNTEEILPLFDTVILLKIGHEATKHRLTTRTSNDFGRTDDVQDWILSWKEWWEETMEDAGAIVVYAHGNLDGVAKEVIQKATDTDALANSAMDRGT